MTNGSFERIGFRFGNLLIPIDLTAASDRVLGRVALLPLAPNARLTLLHVVPDHLPVRSRRRAERDAMKALTEEARNLASSLPGKVTIVPVVTAGAAVDEIASRSLKTRADMIVMGRAGGRALRELFLGSTAERVIRRAQLPVLAVRLPPRAPYRRPAIALDDDRAAAAALSQLLRMIPSPRPPVTVIHACDALLRGRIYPSLSVDDAAEYRDEHRREAARKVGKLLEGALSGAKVRPKDTPVWRTHFRFDAPRLVIAKAIQKAETDLLVLGTRGRSGLRYAFLGSVAGEVLRSSSCDVLVVPPSSRD